MVMEGEENEKVYTSGKKRAMKMLSPSYLYFCES